MESPVLPPPGHARSLTVRRLARELLDRHGLRDWAFGFNRRVRGLGLCRHDLKVIELSWHFAQRNTEDEIIDTLLHEVAHALAGPGTATTPPGRPSASRSGRGPSGAARPTCRRAAGGPTAPRAVRRSAGTGGPARPTAGSAARAARSGAASRGGRPSGAASACPTVTRPSA